MRVMARKDGKGDGQQVFSCISIDRNGTVTGYFARVDNVVCDCVCKIASRMAAQLLYWLMRRGCITKEVEK